MSPAMPEAMLESLMDEVEALTVQVTATQTQEIRAIHQKATLLRDRLVCDLDGCVAGEAVTLALFASLLLDLTELAA
jgi:hypothetical protein